MNLPAKLNFFLFRSFFTCLRRRYPLKAKEIRLTTQSRVLIFANTGLGDNLEASVISRVLAETYPGIYLAAVVHHRRPYIARRNPFLSAIYLCSKGPFAFFKLWRRLRSEGPWDAILYGHCNDPEPRCLGYLLNRNGTVGLAHATKFGDLCARNLPLPSDRHMLQQPLKLAAQVGGYTEVPRMVYEVAEEDRESLTERLTALNLPQAPQIVFQLGGGGQAYRDWPLEHFVELAHGLQKAGIGPIFLLGGPDHREKAIRYANEARQKNLEFFDVVGKLNFYLAGALLERCQCLVSTDTGIMHLGFALDVPTVALLPCNTGCAQLGPTVNQHLHEVIELPRPPHYRSPSDISMSTLRPETVLPRVLALLQRTWNYREKHVGNP